MTEANQVPLVELLAAVPADIRIGVDDGNDWKAGTTWHPVGLLCHEAAAELRRLQSMETESKERILRLEGALTKEVAINAQLLEALGEAADDIESWGAYATEYFQTKHDLLGAVNKARAAIAAAKDSNAA
jgi:hypothetical protein